MGALAALGFAAFSYSSDSGSQLFLSERITEEEMVFMRWLTEYSKSYGTKAEFEFRYEEFKKTMEKIAAHNSNDAHKSTVGLNEFSDYTVAEWKKMNGYKYQEGKERKVKLLDVSTMAASVDWRDEGAVSPVKNQGQCGSCWAFSTTGAIEGAYEISGGYLEYFSEQQLVDCSTQNNGCNGGLMDYGFAYAEENPLMLEAAYPYTAKQATCKYDASKGYGRVQDYHDVTPNDADQLRAALNKGPVSIAVEADEFSFQGYTGGVVTSGCGKKLDHGVLAVGYGTDEGQEFFIVKNSWGPSWGANGYVKIAPDQCGVTNQPSYTQS